MWSNIFQNKPGWWSGGLILLAEQLIWCAHLHSKLAATTISYHNPAKHTSKLWVTRNNRKLIFVVLFREEHETWEREAPRNCLNRIDVRQMIMHWSGIFHLSGQRNVWMKIFQKYFQGSLLFIPYEIVHWKFSLDWCVYYNCWVGSPLIDMI